MLLFTTDLTKSGQKLKNWVFDIIGLEKNSKLNKLEVFIYSHPQTDCFVLSELFSVARPAGRSKPGSKPVQLYIRLSLRPLGHQYIYIYIYIYILYISIIGSPYYRSRGCFDNIIIICLSFLSLNLRFTHFYFVSIYVNIGFCMAAS